MPTLLVLHGNDQGAKFTLMDSDIGIGRDASNAIRLHDTEVSRRHAGMIRQGATYLLRDLNSANGTFVGGRRVSEFMLRPGDRIEVGGSILLYTGVTDPADDLVHRVRVSPESGARILHSVSPRPSSQPGMSHGGASHGGVVLNGEESSYSSIAYTLVSPEADTLMPGGAGHRKEPLSPVSPPPIAGEWLRQAEENLSMMYEITAAISQTVEIDELLRRILDLIFDWVSPDRSCILLFDERLQEFIPKAQRSRVGYRRRMTISQTILEYVRERREGVLTSDALEDQRFDAAKSIVSHGVREAICVPMPGRYGLVGAIYIDTGRSLTELAENPSATRFTESHLRLMAAIGGLAALAVEDTRYYASAIAAEHLAAVGQTIATISHHIKNILQGISGGSYLVEQGMAKEDWTMLRSGWGIVTRNQQRIGSLVMDMLTLSKERETEPQPTDLNALVGEIVELMRQYAADQGVLLCCEFADEVPICDFDPESLHKAILNLVTNGIDAAAPANRPIPDDVSTDDGIPGDGKNADICTSEKFCTSVDADESEAPVPGHLWITTGYDVIVRQLRIIVEDDGPGIPEDQIPALFRPFISTKKHRGTGLGLPVSEKILREHGGHIRVESVVGQGTRFTLEWPAVISAPPVAELKNPGEEP